jgi:hypothetical protein
MAMNVETGIGTDVFTHAQDTQQHLSLELVKVQISCIQTNEFRPIHSNKKTMSKTDLQQKIRDRSFHPTCPLF